MSNVSAKFQYESIKDGEMTAISKQALFSTFYTQQRKDDIIVDLIRIFFIAKYSSYPKVILYKI